MNDAVAGTNNAQFAQVANQLVSSGGSLSDSVESDTKDVDLQRSDVEEAALADRSAALANQFQMSLDGATQLTELADKVQALSSAGTMTTEDRQAITQAALSVAGLSSDDVNQATAKIIQTGNCAPLNDLMTKAASNLGMSSADGIREQILPTLGINIPQCQ